jgi:ABC-2 type transport system permease protein
MNNLLPLMRREWLQHRFAWSLLLLVPLALAVLPLTFGDVQLDGETSVRTGPDLALMVALISIVATTAIIFLILWISSVFVAVGTPRRDHGDRSIEFWMSLPTGHTVSLVAPMLVHLVLVPAAALLAGWVAGMGVSLLTVTRFESLSGWFQLPWAQLLGATAAAVARVIAGVPLATLWLLPLLLLAMLSNALFKRWGLPVLVVALTVGSSVLQQVFGQTWLADILQRLGNEALLALAGASGQAISVQGDDDPYAILLAWPAWAVRDLWAAIQNLASPAFVAAMLASAACLAALVLWRQRGAGHAGA